MGIVMCKYCSHFYNTASHHRCPPGTVIPVSDISKEVKELTMSRCPSCQLLVRVGENHTCPAIDYSSRPERCPICRSECKAVAGVYVCFNRACSEAGIADPRNAVDQPKLKKTDLGNNRPLNMDLLEKLAGMPIYGEVIRMFTAQQEKGLEKYGELLELENYSFTEWIEHAQMECVDKLLYLEGIKQKALQLNKVVGNP